MQCFYDFGKLTYNIRSCYVFSAKLMYTQFRITLSNYLGLHITFSVEPGSWDRNLFWLKIKDKMHSFCLLVSN